jgi:hypothetical protein
MAGRSGAIGAVGADGGAVAGPLDERWAARAMAPRARELGAAEITSSVMLLGPDDLWRRTLCLCPERWCFTPRGVAATAVWNG